MIKTTDAKPRLRILAVGWEGGGNVPPTLAAIRALVARGHDVRLMADDAIKADAIEAGARFLPWKRAPNRPDRSSGSCFVRDWEIADPMAGFQKWCERIFIGPAQAYALDILEALDDEAADLLIGSDLLFGSTLAAEISGIPSVLLAANISLSPLPGHPPFGPGFQPARSDAERGRDADVSAMVAQLWNSFLPTLNTARAHFGLAPLTRLLDQPLAVGRQFLATSPSFDFPCDQLPDHVRYVGPLLETPSWAASFSSRPRADATRPLVLVSFSTTNQGQAAALQRVVSALADEPIEAIVTLGKALEGLELEAPGNVTVLASAPHDAILMQANAVVTHGGHGTLMRSLRHGVPLLVLPMGRDQNDNAARVEYHGAGLRLDPSAEPQAIAAAVRRILSEPSFAKRAGRLAQAIATEGPGPDRLVSEIELFAAETITTRPVRAA